MKMNAIVVGLFACTSLFACATNETDGAPTTITGAEVTITEEGRATVTGNGLSFELHDLSLLELTGADSKTSTHVRQVGCQISSCESCTCYPDGACICTNCKCISR